MKIYLSGGGDDIYRILDGLAGTGVFRGARVGYVFIAAETQPALFRAIKLGFSRLSDHLMQQLGAQGILPVTSANLGDLHQCDVVVLSGGDTAHLIDILSNSSFKADVACGRYKALVGISAGALALAAQGFGIRGGKPHCYDGLGIVETYIVPHSNAAKKAAYPEALHLDEYTFLEYPL